MSFERYIQPYQIYGEEYRRQEDALNELEMKASIWEGLANQQTDKVAYAQYKQYADALREQAGMIAQHGLSIGSRRALNELKRRYVSEILPIEQAYTRRAEQQKAQREILQKDPTRIFNNMASQQSLDYYMQNPTYDATEQQVSGAMITSMVSQAGQKIAQELSSYGIRNLPGDSYTNMLVKSHGLKLEDVVNYLKNPNDPSNKPVLQALVSQAVGTTGIDKWNNIDALNRANQYGNLGLWDTIGKTETQLVADFAKQKALEHQYHEQEAASAFNRQVQLENLKHQNTMEEIGARYGTGDGTNGGMMFGADDISFENGQMVIKDPTTGESIPLGSLGSLTGAGGSGGSGGSGKKGSKSSSKSGSGSGGGNGLNAIGTLPFNTVPITSPNYELNSHNKKVNRSFEALGGNKSNQGINGSVSVPVVSTSYRNPWSAGGSGTTTVNRQFKLWGTTNNGKPSYIMSEREFVGQGKNDNERKALRKYYREQVIPAKKFFGLASVGGSQGRVTGAASRLTRAYNDRWDNEGSVTASMIPLKMEQNDRQEAIGWMVNRTSHDRNTRGDIRQITSWDKHGNITFGERVPANELINEDGTLVDINTELLDRGVPSTGGENDAFNYIIVHAGGKYYAFPKSKMGTILESSYKTAGDLMDFNSKVMTEVNKLSAKIMAESPSLKKEKADEMALELFKQLNPWMKDTSADYGAAYLRQLLGGLNYNFKVDASKIFTTTINSQQ